MKKTFKYLTLSGLGGLLCLFLAIPADAQRGGHGGGGGGFHGGGGGGFHGGGGSFHGGGGFSGGGFRGNTGASVRSSGGGGRVMATPQARSYAAPTNRGAYIGGRNMATSRGAYVGGNGVTRIGGTNRAYIGGRAYVGGYGRNYYGGYRGGYYGPWGYHGGFYYNRGFYSSLYYPRLGFRLGYLPYGYYPFWWGDSEFYYSNGFYYNYDDGQYTVVEPPVGAAINTLPSGAQSIVINGQQYYELNGVYYQPITKDDGTVVYQIAGKDGQLQTNDGGQVSQGYNDQGTYNDNGGVQTHPNPRMGDMIQDLPQDSRRVRVNGQVLYVTPDDVYLKQTKDADGNKAYVVVGLPNENE